MLLGVLFCRSALESGLGGEQITPVLHLKIVAGDQDTSGSDVELNLSEACSHFILENGGWR